MAHVAFDHRVVISAEQRHGKKHVKTMTFDNGTEFFYHRLLPSWFKVKVFFADPYCSGQRGTNENTNGLLWQYFPKGVGYGSIGWQ
uniref:IS30 family transposase n=1 Tax=Rhodopirellula bahusiensis TaxID=2014065 RepID=UPI0026CC22F4|nr:IS30 family transposase [Rhodopirellula bahusiensis]